MVYYSITRYNKIRYKIIYSVYKSKYIFVCMLCVPNDVYMFMTHTHKHMQKYV